MRAFFAFALLLFLFGCTSTVPIASGPPSPPVRAKILVVVTSHADFDHGGGKTGYWMGEVTHFYDVVRRRGFGVDFVSPKGGAPPLDERSRDDGDPVNRAFAVDPEGGRRLAQSVVPSAVKAEDYVAIYFAGGHGPLWDLPEHKELQALTRAVYERGGVVSAVCHGPAGLLNVTLSDGKRLLAGREVTALTNTEESLAGHKGHVPFLLEDEMTRRGASFQAGLPFFSHVVVSGRLVTGQNPSSTKAVAEAVVKLLPAK